MGTTNHGTQEITIEYYEEATAFDVNKRNIDIVPRGIYSGGHLTRISDTEVTLSPFSVEIGDDDIQVSVKTSAAATLKTATLDSGSIDPSTPYLVLRWSYLAQQNNYVEIHAIASVSAAQDNDIIIGKCVFAASVITGFDYTDRTFISNSDIFLRIEEDSGLYVWVRNGRIQTTSGYILIPEQRVGPFSVPGSPNSRIDLVYVDTDGSINILQGTAAVSPSAPSYDGKLVLAEVLLVNGDTSIPASRITDVRSFITAPTSSIDSDGLVKAWVTFAGRSSDGSCTIQDSYNVSSVSRISTGVYRITFASAFSNQYYVFSGFARGINNIADNSTVGLEKNGSKTSSHCDIRVEEGNDPQNPTEIGVMFVGS